MRSKLDELVVSIEKSLVKYQTKQLETSKTVASELTILRSRHLDLYAHSCEALKKGDMKEWDHLSLLIRQVRSQIMEARQLEDRHQSKYDIPAGEVKRMREELDREYSKAKTSYFKVLAKKLEKVREEVEEQIDTFNDVEIVRSKIAKKNTKEPDNELIVITSKLVECIDIIYSALDLDQSE